MADPKEVGHISATLYDDGTIAIDIERVHYVQQYGIARALDEMARQIQATEQLRQLQQQGKGLQVARSIPT